MNSLDNELLYVAGIMDDSIVDGPGLRTTIFLQGCTNHCKGCHNPETWDYSKEVLEKKKMTFKEVLDRIKANEISNKITFSGGDPALQAKRINKFIEYMRANNINHEIMVFTGFTMPALMSNIETVKLLLNIDLLIDGPFIEEQKSLELKFRGSKNQMYWYKKDDYFVCEDDSTKNVSLRDLKQLISMSEKYDSFKIISDERKIIEI